MSWLTELINGDKKVWKKIRNAGYRTLRGYLGGRLNILGVNEKMPDLSLDDLVGFVEGFDAFRQQLPELYRPQADRLLERFIKGH